MAEKRMFAKSIVCSDLFYEMPASSRLLYYDLGMAADDDGFIGNAKSIMRMTGAREDDLNVLLARGLVYKFNNSLVLILDWLSHNTIRKDMYKPSRFDERNRLNINSIKKRYSVENTLTNRIIGPKQQDIPEIVPDIVDLGNDGNTDVSCSQDSICDYKQEYPDEELIYQELEIHGIKRNSSEARKIASKNSYKDVMEYTNYALTHKPPRTRNLAGWIITCINCKRTSKVQHTDKSVCDLCHGTGEYQLKDSYVPCPVCNYKNNN